MVDFKKYIISYSSIISDALKMLNELSDDVLTLFVIDDSGRLTGTLTDGDIRRHLLRTRNLDDCVCKAMNPNFHFLKENEIDIPQIKEYKKKGVEMIPIVDQDCRIKDFLNLKEKKSLVPVDAVLMAGGKGERLKPFTDSTPKPLLKLGDRSIIDYNIDSLISYGINNINVTTNYLAEQIESHFKDKTNTCQIKCVREPKYLGTIGSIKFVEGLENDTILIMNSDLFTNINYEDFYLHFKKYDADMSVATVPYAISVPYGICELNERNITGLREKPTYNYYANSGIYLIKRELIDMVPDNTFFNATDLIEKLISENRNVIRFPLVGYWIDIGKHEDYKKAQDFVKHL